MKERMDYAKYITNASFQEDGSVLTETGDIIFEGIRYHVLIMQDWIGGWNHVSAHPATTNTPITLSFLAFLRDKFFRAEEPVNYFVPDASQPTDTAHLWGQSLYPLPEPCSLSDSHPLVILAKTLFVWNRDMDEASDAEKVQYQQSIATVRMILEHLQLQNAIALIIQRLQVLSANEGQQEAKKVEMEEVPSQEPEKAPPMIDVLPS